MSIRAQIMASKQEHGNARNSPVRLCSIRRELAILFMSMRVQQLNRLMKCHMFLSGLVIERGLAILSHAHVLSYQTDRCRRERSLSKD